MSGVGKGPVFTWKWDEFRAGNESKLAGVSLADSKIKDDFNLLVVDFALATLGCLEVCGTARYTLNGLKKPRFTQSIVFGMAFAKSPFVTKPLRSKGHAMSTATVTKPKMKKAKPKRMVSPKPNGPEGKSKIDATREAETKRKCGSSALCENCMVSVKAEKPARKKKKPMYKVGSWRGLFKGTMDF